MQHPQINLNGSSRERLQEAWQGAHRRLTEARDALCEAAPHGRDYQLQPGTYVTARKEHEARLTAINQIMDELVELYQGVDE